MCMYQNITYTENMTFLGNQQDSLYQGVAGIWVNCYDGYKVFTTQLHGLSRNISLIR